MNLRAFKKRERRSLRKLIKLGGADKSEVFISDGDDSIYAPTDLNKRNQSHGFVNDNALRGVPLIGRITGYYEPEWDAYLPSAELAQWRFATETDWEAIWNAEEAALLDTNGTE
jgi:hypothetical protein